MADPMNMPLDQFQMYLREVADMGGDVDALVRQYRRNTSAFPGLLGAADQNQADMASQGRRSVGGGLLSKESGTTGMDALRSVQFEPRAFLTGLLGAGANALDAPRAAYDGLIPEQDMTAEALGTAGFASLGGAAATAPSGALRAGVARDGASVAEMLADVRLNLAARDVSVAELSASDGSVRMKASGGLNALVSPAPDRPGQWRVTYMGDDGQPNGHVDATDKAGAVRRAMEDGFSASANASATSGTVASEVAGLLRNNRAADVTDDMMARVDPQEMFRLYEQGATGMPMPMDNASRMARAEGMGFDTGTPLYRGDATPDLQSFNTGQGARDGIGVTSSNSPNVAATYMAGSNPAMYPLMSRARNQLELDAQGRNWTGIPADARANNSSLDQLLDPESYLDDDNLFDFTSGSVADWGDGTATPLAMTDTNSVARAAQANGFDEVRFSNIVDRGGAARFHTGPANDPNMTVMTANPSNIRSQFARFDPRLSHLSNLSAANVSPTAGLLGSAVAQEQQALPFQKFLRGLFE